MPFPVVQDESLNPAKSISCLFIFSPLKIWVEAWKQYFPFATALLLSPHPLHYAMLPCLSLDVRTSFCGHKVGQALRASLENYLEIVNEDVVRSPFLPLPLPVQVYGDTLHGSALSGLSAH